MSSIARIVTMLNQTVKHTQDKVSTSGNGLFDSLIDRLIKDNTGNRINLSKILHPIETLSQSKGNLLPGKRALPGHGLETPQILDVSAALDLEAMLRSFNLPTKDIDQIVGTAKVAGGGIDLDVFILELKKAIPHQDPSLNAAAFPPGKSLNDPALNGLGTISSAAAQPNQASQISIKDFVATLEVAAGSRTETNRPVLMDPSSSQSMAEQADLSQMGARGNAGNDTSLESLRRGLLSGGKTLDQFSLKNKDVPLLKTFLHECGYSKADTDSIINRLMDDSTGNTIKLSDVFHHAEALNLPKHTALPGEKAEIPNPGKPTILDASATSDLESILRNFRLPTGSLEQIIGIAKGAGGDESLNRRPMSQPPISSTPGPQGQQTGQVSTTDLAAALAHFAGNRTKLGQPSPNSTTPAVQMRDKMIVQGENRQTTMAPQTGPNPDQADPWLRGRVAGKNQSLPGLGTTATQMAQQQQTGEMPLRDLGAAFGHIAGKQIAGKPSVPNSIPPLDKIIDKTIFQGGKQKPEVGAQAPENSGRRDSWLNSPLEAKTQVFSGRETQKPFSVEPSDGKNPGVGINRGETVHLTGIKGDSSQFDKIKPFNPLDGGGAPEKEIKPLSPQIHGTARSTDMVPEIARTLASESSNSVGPQDRSERALPGYLIDQVGRQISRSIIRGQKNIRLQLKPPEMGALKIEIDIQNSGLKLGVIAESSSAKELLLANLPQLREALGEQGIKLDRLDVQVGSNNFDQSLADLKDRSNGESNQGQNGLQKHGKGPVPDAFSEEDLALLAGDQSNPGLGHRLLDLMA